MTTMVWVLNDFRLKDNPALSAAASAGQVVLIHLFPLVNSPVRKPGTASQWWKRETIQRFQQRLYKMGGGLILRSGSPETMIPTLCREMKVDRVVWNRSIEPDGVFEQEQVKSVLVENGILFQEYPGNWLFEPGSIINQAGEPYKMFSPFARSIEREGVFGSLQLVPEVTDLSFIEHECAESVPNFGLSVDYSTYWQPGEIDGIARWNRFLETGIRSYEHDRNFPGIDGTSKMSPYLRFGEVSVRMMEGTLSEMVRESAGSVRESIEKYRKELLWREFAIHLLAANPMLAERPVRTEFESFPWRDDREDFMCWIQGETGYPIVDAGMRELQSTGWMHNRVRMIVASFLVKNLLLPWQWGEEWFWENLVDADWASNAVGWQWSAGTAVDSTPFVRIFNPEIQAKKFDYSGTYVKKWLNLEELSTSVNATDAARSPYNIAKIEEVLKGSYPQPMIDHSTARRRALDTYRVIHMK